MDVVTLKIRRQDDPDGLAYWEKFEIPFESGMTVARALESIGELIECGDGSTLSPVAFEGLCGKGACGACTMIINGRVRLACATLIEELEDPVTLMPLGKFPVVRDLVINRDSMLASMGRCELWLDVDDYELRSGELFSQDGDGQNRFEGCIFCGACLEACPQYCDRSRYMGAFVFGNMASLNLSTAGRKTSEKRFLLSAARGGVADCAGVSNCDMVCPAGIELSSAIGEINRSAISSSMKNYFRA